MPPVYGPEAGLPLSASHDTYLLCGTLNFCGPMPQKDPTYISRCTIRWDLHCRWPIRVCSKPRQPLPHAKKTCPFSRQSRNASHKNTSVCRLRAVDSQPAYSSCLQRAWHFCKSRSCRLLSPPSPGHHLPSSPIIGKHLHTLLVSPKEAKQARSHSGSHDERKEGKQ